MLVWPYAQLINNSVFIASISWALNRRFETHGTLRNVVVVPGAGAPLISGYPKMSSWLSMVETDIADETVLLLSRLFDDEMNVEFEVKKSAHM